MSQCFRVLLVEDDDSLRGCLGEFLAGHGWTVAATAYAVEALTLVRQQRFDFSLLDFHLPGMTGLQLFHQLASVRPMPSILMSGLASIEEITAAQSAGFFTFLRKPLELEHLRHSLELLIKSHFGGPVAQHLPPSFSPQATQVTPVTQATQVTPTTQMRGMPPLPFAGRKPPRPPQPPRR